MYFNNKSSRWSLEKRSRAQSCSSRSWVSPNILHDSPSLHNPSHLHSPNVGLPSHRSHSPSVGGPSHSPICDSPRQKRKRSRPTGPKRTAERWFGSWFECLQSASLGIGRWWCIKVGELDPLYIQILNRCIRYRMSEWTIWQWPTLYHLVMRRLAYRKLPS